MSGRKRASRDKRDFPTRFNAPKASRPMGRLMESEWLITEHFLDGSAQAHAFRYFGPAGGYAESSECKQSVRDLAAVAVLWPGSKPNRVSRCERCEAIMALPGMTERRRGDDGE